MRLSPPGPIAVAALLALVGACAEGVRPEKRKRGASDAAPAGAPDALIGRAGPGATGGGPGPGGFGGAPGACQPGAPLDLCAVCGPDGRPRPAEDDERCPALDCAALDTYARAMQDGVALCVRQRHAPIAGRCVAVGQCRDADDAGACGRQESEVAARADQPCRVMEGCDGRTPPSFAPAPAGTPCEGGVCDDAGNCVPVVDDDRCDGFGDHRRCGAGVHPDGTPYCEVAVPDAAEHCIAICGAFNARCLAAATAGDNPCVPAEERGCLDAAAPLICRCSAPR